MGNDIEFLIRELEEERTNLKRMIRDAIAEGEYLIAHYHSNALQQVSLRLQTLRNLDDKLFEQKKMFRSLIQGSEEMQKGDHSECRKIAHPLGQALEKGF